MRLKGKDKGKGSELPDEPDRYTREAIGAMVAHESNFNTSITLMHRFIRCK